MFTAGLEFSICHKSGEIPTNSKAMSRRLDMTSISLIHISGTH